MQTSVCMSTGLSVVDHLLNKCVKTKNKNSHTKVACGSKRIITQYLKAALRGPPRLVPPHFSSWFPRLNIPIGSSSTFPQLCLCYVTFLKYLLKLLLRITILSYLLKLPSKVCISKPPFYVVF